MLGEKFEMWPANPLSNAILITVSMHVINLGYLEDGPPCFTEFSNGSTKESNKMLVGLDTTAVIPETDNQDPPDLIDLEVKRTNKKKEKAERRWQRKINLAQATTAGNAPSSLVASACHSLSSPVASAGGAGDTSTGGAPSSPGGDPLSTVLSRFSSLITAGGPSSAVSGCPSSLVAGDGLLFAVFGGDLLSSLPTAGS